MTRRSADRGAGRTLPAVALSIVILLSAVPLAALDPSRLITEYGRKVLQDDLPQNTVHTIVQTRDGYVWMGTFEGLVRFDGVRFTVYNTRNTPAMRSNGVLALHEDRAGALWIGTDGGGVAVVRRGVIEPLATPAAFARSRVSGIAQDAGGALWFATRDGLLRYDGARFTTVDRSNGLRANEVRSVEADPDGSLWAGLEEGWLCRVGAGGVRCLGRADGLPAASVRTLHRAPDGTLWAGTDGAGIVQVRNGLVAGRLTTAEGLKSDAIRRILTDRDGNVWIATNGGGLNRYHRGAFSYLTTAEGLATNLVRSLWEDREGNLWVGTNGGGALLLRDDKFVTYGALEGMAGENVRAVTEDRNGTVWIGTDGGGLFQLQNGAAVRFPGQEDLGSAFVRALLADRRGDLWVGTVGSGAARISGGKVVQRIDGLSSLSVSAIHEDSRGRVWIATADRELHVLENGVLSTAKVRPDAPVMLVGNIFEDRERRLWFSSDRGLYVLDGDRWQHLTKADGLPDDVVFSVYQDREGTHWIGTTRGLSRYRGGRFTRYSVDDGLADDIAFSILEDDAGYLWMTSNRGINRVRRSDFDAYDAKRIRAIRSQLFDRSDGLRSSQCNGRTQPSAWRGRDGRLWFATVRGVSVIDPARIKFNQVPPPIVIEQLIVDGRSVPLDRAISLGPRSRRIEIHYTALSFMAPERVRFRFRLEGDGGAWVDVGNRRAAYYDSIAPGRYRFIVQATNNDGVWSRVGSALQFRVVTPLWRRWWALLAYVIAAVAVAWLVFRWRIVALENRARVLEARVAERTAEIAEKVQQLEVSEARAKEASEAKGRFLAHMSHELRTPLNAILGFVQLMERTPGRASEDRDTLSVITRSGRHLLALINDVLSMAKIEAGKQVRNDAPFDLRHLVSDAESLFRGRAAESGVRFDAVVAPDIPLRVVGDEGKLRQVLINLLGNALKFTERGSVTLSVEPSASAVRFSVADTGPGLTPDEIAMLTQPFVQAEHGRHARDGTGLGLSISRTFVELLGGELKIESTPGQGSRFWFELPLPAVEAPGESLDQRRVVGLEPSPRAPRILVADDNALSRLVLGRLLRSVGFDVMEVGDGVAAIEAWRSGEPGLIFMDMHMPLLDGDDAAAAIREEEKLSDRTRATIIALTASVFEHDRDRLLSRGCDDFISKPFLASTIFEAIARYHGVRYVYGDPSEAQEARQGDSDVPALDGLDRAWLDSMREALEGGDVERATGLADSIAAEHEQLADAIRNLVRTYRFDDVLRAISQAR